MFQHQDVLYRNGPLATVWLLGNRSLQWKKGKLRLRATILRASVSELCDLVRGMIAVPRPIKSGDGPGRMSMNTITILVIGLNRMYKMQMDSFLKRLDEIYAQIRFRMLPYGDIDLPAETGRRGNDFTTTVATDAASVNFGQFEFDPMMEPQWSSQQGNSSSGNSISLNPSTAQEIDVAAALMSSKKEQAHKRKKDRKTGMDRGVGPENEIDDNALIRLLETSRSTVNFNDVTMQDDEHLRMPNYTDAENNFRFGDEEEFGQNTLNPMPVNVDQSHEQPTDSFQQNSEHPLDAQVPEAMETRENESSANAAQIDPVDSISLAQRIRISRSTRPIEPPSEPEHSRKRRKRNPGLIFDSQTNFSSQEMNQRRREVEENSQNLQDELVSARVAILPDTHTPFYKQNSKTIKHISSVFGRSPGIILSRFISNVQSQIGSAQSNPLERTNEFLREGSEIQNLSDSAPRVGPCEESSAAPDNTITAHTHAASTGISGAEEGTLPSNVPLKDATNEPVTPSSNIGGSFGFEPQPYNDNMNAQDALHETTFLAEEMPTPFPQKDAEFRRPMDVPPFEPHMIEGDNDREKRKFSQLFPPEVTSRRKAGHEFFRLLRLQKEKKVQLHQHSFLGELAIEVLGK